ncbi:MAG: hypothetical protein LRZ88_11130, partial [Candidatus Cloacimonetes bacterium]|nr:hypothetical protein [Candidatus Cloacimonadota bacterium]
FLSSYMPGKTKNQFTKVSMNLESDLLLLEYFRENISSIEGWFNVISPREKGLVMLKNELQILKDKDWSKIR